MHVCRFGGRSSGDRFLLGKPFSFSEAFCLNLCEWLADMPRPFLFCSDCGAAEPRQVSEREFRCVACEYRHFVTLIPAAVAVVQDAEGRVLIIRRAIQPGLGLLGLPGGVIEADETGEMAAARETCEECGIDISPKEFRYLGTVNNRYDFQGYIWPTIDLVYSARVQSFDAVRADPTEVQEWFALAPEAVPFDEFAFWSNAEAVRMLRSSPPAFIAD